MKHFSVPVVVHVNLYFYKSNGVSDQRAYVTELHDRICIDSPQTQHTQGNAAVSEPNTQNRSITRSVKKPRTARHM